MGIELSARLRTRISDLQDDLRPRLRAARWVPAANLHLMRVVIKDFGVSRRHAEVVMNGGECRVVDLKSKNGNASQWRAGA